jgi:beta-lactamase superfamily II metal-dependent hydrolase
MAAALIVFLGITKYQRTYRNDLLLTCLDVGHGQAIFAQLPGKANILFDAGSLYKNDIGQRIIAPFLDYIGTNRIDAIIISHNDFDHINGIPEIVDHCRVGAVYANDAFFSQTGPWPTARFLTQSLHERRFEVKTLQQNLNLHSSANISMLWPGKDISQYEQLSDNDKSQVLLIEFAGTKILLCSDIEQFAQKELLRLFPNLKPNILVVPHHGSINTMAADAVAADGHMKTSWSFSREMTPGHFTQPKTVRLPSASVRKAPSTPKRSALKTNLANVRCPVAQTYHHAILHTRYPRRNITSCRLRFRLFGSLPCRWVSHSRRRVGRPRILLP